MSCWRSTTPRRTSRELRAGEGILRPLLADRGELHVELRPQPLGAELHVLQHLRRVGRGGGDDVAVLGEARGGAVVQHQAILAQHQAVARLADGQRLPAVAVEAVEELGRVRALQVDLAERGHIAHADARAHRAHLAVDAARTSRSRRAADTIARAARRRPRRTRRRAPRAHPCDGGSRVGRKSLPRCAPASAPMATGVKGGRKVVVPVCAMVLAVNSAISARPVTLEVLPWSVAMPSVV